jgi:hypothetical protein
VFDEFLVVLKPGLKGEFEQVTPELVQGEGLRGVSLGEQVVFFGRKDRIDKGRYSFASSQATVSVQGPDFSTAKSPPQLSTPMVYPVNLHPVNWGPRLNGAGKVSKVKYAR